MNSHQLIDDLISVPGVHGAILFQPKEAPQRFWLEDSDWAQPGDKFLRGAGQMIRRLCDTHDRVELRYLKGRFIIQSLAGGAAIACFTDKELNLPLLNLTLDEIVQNVQTGVETPVSSVLTTAPSVATSSPIATEAAPLSDPVSVAPVPQNSQPASVQSEPVTERPSAKEEPAVQFHNESALSPAGNFSAENGQPGLNNQKAESIENLLDFLTDDEHPREMLNEEEEISSQQAEAFHSVAEEPLDEQEEIEPLSSHAGIAAGLSDLSMIAMGYLGRSLVIGCWRQTQPAELHGLFHISQDGVIEAENDLAAGDNNTIRLARDWAQLFVSRCNLVTIDLPLHLVAPLNADAQALLTASASFADRGIIILQYDYLSRMLSGNRQSQSEGMSFT